MSRRIKQFYAACVSNHSLIDGVTGGLLGFLVFVLVYGFIPLNVTYDHWILSGYIEDDVIQHYAGWVAYRDSDWSWPLGLMEGLGGGTVTYTDSIPWAAILFKIFSPLLPDTFQYFGLWVCLCYVLQGVAGTLLVGCVTKNRAIIYLGAFLFVVSPIMMERAFRHTALASHWLVLFSLYELFRSRQTKKLSWTYCVLSVLSIGIHPYFLPMVFAVMLANILDLGIRDRSSFGRSALIFFAAIVLTLLAGYAIGALGMTTSMGGSGFGSFSMNLNALVNPTSCSVVWSSLLPVREQMPGNYDGFNYLGLGVLCGLLVSLIVLVAKQKLVSLIKNNVCIVVLGVLLMLFAVSNIVSLDGQILFSYPLPEKLLKIAAVFRSSGRLFYPVYYLLILLCIYAISLLHLPWSKIVLGLVVVLQVVDISPALQAKHESFDEALIEESYEHESLNGNPMWIKIANGYDHMKVLESFSISPRYRLAAFGVLNGLTSEISIENRDLKNPDDLSSRYDAYYDELMSEEIDERSAYIAKKESVVRGILENVESVAAYELDGFYVIVSNDNDVLRGEVQPFDPALKE